ncbi:hypothetical protein EV421DRAFT_1914363 [Armillaria borealis]|uniref:Uncharacterized protein n=1 Tax=Armillaria borealis TaxID=47425 RepID=A0AA39MDE3_9AGAR|nr:hypothetical protein EV421DRAFT_1914363 [Armillaria borealis]
MLDEDSDKADESLRVPSFSLHLFQLMPAIPGDNPFFDESDLDSDMPPLASANIMLPEYVDSISSSNMSESESNEDYKEHTPLILNGLLQANLKNSHYVLEMAIVSELAKQICRYLF